MSAIKLLSNISERIFWNISSSHFQSNLLWSNFWDLERSLWLIQHLIYKIKWNLRTGDLTGTQKNSFEAPWLRSLCFKFILRKSNVIHVLNKTFIFTYTSNMYTLCGKKRKETIKNCKWNERFWQTKDSYSSPWDKHY